MSNQAAKIFWSWQSDYSPKSCRHVIRQALVEAIAQLADEIGVDAEGNRLSWVECHGSMTTRCAT